MFPVFYLNWDCSDGKVIIRNETEILNQSGANYIKNMTTDN